MRKIGILLINTGTPETPTYLGVRRYLSQFLSDPRVIDISFIARFLLLQFIILPFRSKKSAEAYQKIWTKEGSPLLVYSLSFKNELQKQLGEAFHVVLGMRYGKPSIEQALKELKHCTEIILFPLFPQYASSSTGSALEEVYKHIGTQWNIPNLKSIAPFYKDQFYLKALSKHMQVQLGKLDWDHLVFSFHGLPQHHIEKSGCRSTCALKACQNLKESPYCYRAQCFENVRLLAGNLNLDSSKYSVAFQSRLGRRPWIKPYFDEELPLLLQKGIKKVAVICPSFVADCLETLEEIQIRARESWRALGGEELYLIPCLNDDEAWVKACAENIRAI